MERMDIKDFVNVVPEWRCKYLKNNKCVFKIEALIQRRLDDPWLADSLCEPKVEALIQPRIEALKSRPNLSGSGPKSLEMIDFEIIVRWGSKKMGSRLWGRIEKSTRNTEAHFIDCAAKAFETLGRNQETALTKLMGNHGGVHGLGRSFGSKVLAMCSPDIAPIWDDVAETCLSEFKIGGKRVKSYEQFIRVCEHIVTELKRMVDEGRKDLAPPIGCDGNPRATADGHWWLRDVEMAIFEFGLPKGKRRITGSLP